MTLKLVKGRRDERQGLLCNAKNAPKDALVIDLNDPRQVGDEHWLKSLRDGKLPAKHITPRRHHT